MYRRSILVLLALGAVLGSAACGPAEAAGAPADHIDAFGAAPAGGVTPGAIAAEPTTPGGNPAPGPTDLSPAYPDTAEGYAKAVLTAWVSDQPAALAALTAAAVDDQVIDLLSTVNDQWTFLRCDGTAGSSYCSFTNVDGDLLTLRVSHALLAKAHALIGVSLDKTEYPADGVTYVKEFVGAWQFGNKARMLKLSSATVVAKLTPAPTSPSYPAPDCCGGGLLQVKVQWSGGNARFDVGTTKLGGPNAIVGYAGSLALTS
jgi:hypothetical protein